MVFQGVSPDNSNSQNMSQINDLAREVASKERVQVFKDDAGTRRVLLGKGLNDFYGLKVSPVGTDVYNATDDQLIFNSDQNIFKIVETGITTVTVPSSYDAINYTSTVPHSQSVIRPYLSYINETPYQADIYIETPYSVPSFFKTFVYITATDIVFSVTPDSAGSSASIAGDWKFKYFIMSETLTE